MDAQILGDQVHSITKNHPEISLVYLFGSQVDGSTSVLSDVDLGIVVDPAALDLDYHAVLKYEFSMAFHPDRVDMIVLNLAPVELAYHVITQGKHIFSRRLAEKVEYESTILSRYFDYLPVLRLFRKEIIEGGCHDQRVQRYREAFRRTERMLSQIAAAQRKETK